MKVDEQVLESLNRKKAYFLEYEEETKKLHSNGEDAVERVQEAMAARQRLIELIDEVDAQIRKQCGDTKEGRLLLEACKNRCEYKELLPGYQAVYNAGQQIFQIMTRIQNEEKLASVNMRNIIERLQEQIRQNRQASKVSGYLKNMNYSSDAKKGFLYNDKR